MNQRLQYAFLTEGSQILFKQKCLVRSMASFISSLQIYLPRLLQFLKATALTRTFSNYCDSFILTKIEALPLEMQTVPLMRNFFCMKCILMHKKSDLGMPNNAIRKLCNGDTLFTP